MGKWHFVASICGWLSLLCWLPFLLLTLTPGHLAPYPDWMGAMILRGLFMSPLAGISLALIARNYEETVACACGGMAGCTRVGVVVDGTTPVRYVIRYVIGYLPQRIGRCGTWLAINGVIANLPVN
jgi:hypothetical protein